MFILLAVCALPNIVCNFVFYFLEAVILLNKLYCAYNTRVSVYQVIIIFSNNSFLEFLQYSISYSQEVVNFNCKFKRPVLVLLKQSSFVLVFSFCNIVSLAKSISSAVVFFQSIHNSKLVFFQLLQLSNLLQYQLLSYCKVRQVFVVCKDLKQQATIEVDLLVFQSFYYCKQFLVVYVVPFFYSAKLL